MLNIVLKMSFFYLIIWLERKNILSLHPIIQTFVSMEKYLVNPKASNAFTPEVMHKVVLNGIDFELPEHIWEAINAAFRNYWNVEVGYGGIPDFNSAVSSISNWLQKNHIIFAFDKIITIVNIMFDWIEQIPGATLDEDEVVIPHSFEEFEKQSEEDHEIANDSSYPSYFDFNDGWTNFVFISDKLKEFYPGTYKRLIKLFDKMEIEWAEVKGTKDIWIRDYMPIQIAENHYLVYKYDPDYLKQTGKKYLTNSHTIYKKVLHHYYWKDINITLDGGNVVTAAGYCDSIQRILTDKVFRENGKEPYDPDFCEYLSKALHSDLIFLPWNCDKSENPNADVYGHADGMVRWTGGANILMSNIRDFNPEEADEIRNRLEKAGYRVTEMLFDVPNPNKDYNWAYINYLEVGTNIIVPTFGIPEDKQALEYIRDLNPIAEVKGFRMREIAKNGGALHCITWNIMK